MRAFLVDDEQPCLNELEWQLRKYPDIEVAGAFTDPFGVMAAVAENRPDAVFLDIDMPRGSGLELTLKIQAQRPGVIIIFVTAYAQYALEAFRAFPLDFLLKPVKEARLDETIKHLRAQHALFHASAPDNRIRIRCFGAFELLAGQEAKWGTRRVRELFLFLIDRRGAAPARDEMLGALFGGQSDKSTANNLYMTIYRLRSLLSALDPKGEYISMADNYSLTIKPGICDYTDFMSFARDNAVITGKNAPEAARVLSLFRGPYLGNELYEWAAESARELEAEYERIALGLAGCHAAAGRVPEAENTLTALLSRNPLSSEGYEALLNLYISGDKQAAFRERYEQYARMLKKELRVRPPARYREYYAALRRPSLPQGAMSSSQNVKYRDVG
jgi:two-component SAPR family response regulator